LGHTADLEDVTAKHNVNIHGCADDTQLYLHGHREDMTSTVHRLKNCIIDVGQWISANRLKLNTEKTELLSLVGKNQPILVSVSSADEALAVISSAKKLRQSADPMVNSQVFINVDLTKAQAAAAYEQRCLRRKKLQDRLNQSTRLSTIQVTEDSAVIYSVDLDISRPAKSSDSMQKLSDEGDAAGVNFPASATQAV